MVVDFCTEIVFSVMNETLLRLKKKYKKSSAETGTDKTVYLYNSSHNRKCYGPTDIVRGIHSSMASPLIALEKIDKLCQSCEKNK